MNKQYVTLETRFETRDETRHKQSCAFENVRFSDTSSINSTFNCSECVIASRAVSCVYISAYLQLKNRMTDTNATYNLTVKGQMSYIQEKCIFFQSRFAYSTVNFLYTYM